MGSLSIERRKVVISAKTLAPSIHNDAPFDSARNTRVEGGGGLRTLSYHHPIIILSPSIQSSPAFIPHHPLFHTSILLSLSCCQLYFPLPSYAPHPFPPLPPLSPGVVLRPPPSSAAPLSQRHMAGSYSLRAAGSICQPREDAVVAVGARGGEGGGGGGEGRGRGKDGLDHEWDVSNCWCCRGSLCLW